uniref:Uncharacterized protein n=1 Tax=viral metagenome TaxID=1070528 RepID=A0A6C0I019_9ZZZZ
MSFFGDISNEEFKRQALVIKNSQSSAWDALNLNEYCRNMSYGGNKKDIKYIEEKISKYLASPLLDNFTNIDNIDLQGSTIATNILLMPNADINYIIASMFKDKINCIADIAYIEESIAKQEQLIASFENKVARLLQLTEELDIILSVQCPKYKSQSSIIIQFIDKEFHEFLYLDEDVKSYLHNIKSKIKSGIIYGNTNRSNTVERRYIFNKSFLPIDKIIDKYYKNIHLQLVNHICNKITKINIILNLRGIQIEDAEIIYLRDIIYLQDTDSADNYITYLHRMDAFITQWHKKDLDCPLYKFYKNKSIILSYIDLSEYKDFLLKHIIKIDIYSYWDTYFRDIEFYQMAIILIANKIHYDILCKKYEIAPYEDGGISFLLESFSDESFNIFSKEVESDFALLRL